MCISDVVFEYLDVVPPELQQSVKSSLHLSEQLVKEGQLSHTILIQQNAQTCHKVQYELLPCEYFFYFNDSSSPKGGKYFWLQ